MPESKYPQSPYRRDQGEFAPSFEHILGGRDRIREERERQIRFEGYDLDHDMHHDVRELVDAANCYLFEVAEADKYGTVTSQQAGAHTPVPSSWPWEDAAWRPSGDRLRNLEKAGALYVAASDLMAAVANNVADLIDQEIHKRLVEAGVLNPEGDS